MWRLHHSCRSGGRGSGSRDPRHGSPGHEGSTHLTLESCCCLQCSDGLLFVLDVLSKIEIRNGESCDRRGSCNPEHSSPYSYPRPPGRPHNPISRSRNRRSAGRLITYRVQETISHAIARLDQITGQWQHVHHPTELRYFRSTRRTPLQVGHEGIPFFGRQRVQNVGACEVSIVILLAQSTANPVWLPSSSDLSFCRPIRMRPLTVPSGTAIISEICVWVYPLK